MDERIKRGTKVPRTERRKKSERIPGARNEIYTSQIESVKFIQATTTIGLYKNGIGWMTCIKLTAYHAGQWTKEEARCFLSSIYGGCKRGNTASKKREKSLLRAHVIG